MAASGDSKPFSASFDHQHEKAALDGDAGHDSTSHSSENLDRVSPQEHVFSDPLVAGRVSILGNPPEVSRPSNPRTLYDLDRHGERIVLLGMKRFNVF